MKNNSETWSKGNRTRQAQKPVAVEQTPVIGMFIDFFWHLNIYPPLQVTCLRMNLGFRKRLSIVILIIEHYFPKE